MNTLHKSTAIILILGCFISTSCMEEKKKKKYSPQELQQIRNSEKNAPPSPKTQEAIRLLLTEITKG